MKVCSVDRCGGKHCAKGFCKNCYMSRWRAIPENRQKTNEYLSKWRARPGVKQKIREYTAKKRAKPEYNQKKREYEATPKRKQKNLEYRANPERKRKTLDNLRKYRSGWTSEEFEVAWVKQDGKCAICHVRMLKIGVSNNSVSADHCHKKDKPRSLLCARCNKLEGQVAKNPELVKEIQHYQNYWHMKHEGFSIGEYKSNLPDPDQEAAE